LPLSAGGAFSAAADGSGGLAAGASAGRAFGNGTTAARWTTRCDLGRGGANKSAQGNWSDLRAATAGSASIPNNMATAVINAIPVRPNAPEVDFRLAFSALQFMSIS
jgi:hypothetical protein